jgi:hypothetical protein
MTDTSPRVERRYRKMLLERSGADRLKMGCSMFATARTLVIASVRAKEPSASPAAVRRALFLRFYGGDFGPTSGSTSSRGSVATRRCRAAHRRGFR